MRRFSVLLSLIVVILLGTLALHVQPVAVAQEVTPAAEEFTEEEGITFEPLALATDLTFPATGELFMSRVSFDPGAGFPIEEGDPSYALAVIESGELTVSQSLPLIVTRAGALGAAMGEAEECGAFAPATEEIAAGQEVTVGAGGAVLFPRTPAARSATTARKAPSCWWPLSDHPSLRQRRRHNKHQRGRDWSRLQPQFCLRKITTAPSRIPGPSLIARFRSSWR